MELKDFISQSLSDIVNGVMEAHNNVAESKAIVNMNVKHVTNPPQGIIPAEGARQHSSVVEFDIAVTASDQKSSTGGFGIFVGAFTAGAKQQSENLDSRYSRIRFSVPVQIPLGPLGQKHSQG